MTTRAPKTPPAALATLHVIEHEIDPPSSHAELFDQAQRLLARVPARAWLEAHQQARPQSSEREA